MVEIRPQAIWPNTLLVGVIGLFGACISNVEISGAPCPCPSGYRCCATLNDTCVRDVEGACPSAYPASSRSECQIDDDCPLHELCRSWTLAAAGEVAGPKECRRTCVGAYVCATGEVCEATPHDGRLLDATNVALACLPETSPAGCEGLTCRSCGAERVGVAFCDGAEVKGCFVALHETCGVTCLTVPIQQCGTADCVESADGAQCPQWVFSSWCLEFDCNACGASGTSGSVFCSGDEVVACRAVPVHGDQCNGQCTCDEICVRDVIESCAGPCSEEGGAHCP